MTTTLEAIQGWMPVEDFCETLGVKYDTARRTFNKPGGIPVINLHGKKYVTPEGVQALQDAANAKVTPAPQAPPPTGFNRVTRRK